MEYYVLKTENGYIKDTMINQNNNITNSCTDNVEQARRYESIDAIKSINNILGATIEKITLTKEIIGE